jgi:UDPglucose 6-dehydrogenase
MLCDADVYVVRSSVLPEAFSDLPSECRHHWPEFLTERTAMQDALNPDKIIWGSDLERSEAAYFAHCLLGSHYTAAPVFHTSLEASCLIKIGINAYYTAKVMMANALWDAAGQDPRIYSDICVGLQMDQRINLTHHRVMQDGYRGAGGKCLPKDSRFLQHLLEGHATGKFIAAMCDANDRLRGLV